MDRTNLTVLTIPGPEHVTLRVSGEIDLGTAPQLREAALEALRHHGSDLRLDLRDVHFMDSTGIEVLLATRRRAALEGGSLTLVRPSRPVQRILQVTGVDRLFEITQPSPSSQVTGA
jgi:anti-sigma B factor antagonist